MSTMLNINCAKLPSPKPWRPHCQLCTATTFTGSNHKLDRSISRNMELRHLHYFVAVAEALSFTKAAKNLHLAQPSLTRQIQDLEREIGVQLIDRSGQRISLTVEGQYFLRDAKRLLTESEKSVQAVQRLSRGAAGQLNVGYLANIYQDLLPKTFEAFRKASPHTLLNIFDMTPAEQFQALDERKIIWALSGVSLVRVAVTCSGGAWVRTL